MILPTKQMRADRALIGVGGEVLLALQRPKTVSKLWDELRGKRAATAQAPLNYDWFILSLDLLFLMGAVSLTDGILYRARP